MDGFEFNYLINYYWVSMRRNRFVSQHGSGEKGTCNVIMGELLLTREGFNNSLVCIMMFTC